MKAVLALVLAALLAATAVVADEADVKQDAIMKKIYDSLFYAYTGEGGNGAVLPGLPSGRGADQTFLHIASPGLPIDPGTYANSWSPSNPTGSTDAAEAFSLLVDVVPAMQVVYAPVGAVEDYYNLILGGQEVSSLNVTEEQRQALAKAVSLLNTEGTDYDADGKPVKVQVDSPFYANYKRKKQTYADALSTYLMAYFQYNMSDPADQREWSLLGAIKFTPVRNAWSDFQNSQPGVIEEAIATIAQFQSSSVKQTLQSAKFDFDVTKRTSLREPGRQYHISYAVPANWFSESAAGWATNTISFKQETQDSKSHYESYSAGGGFSFGLWKVGGSFGHSSSDNRTHSTTENVDVSFDFLRVEIQRPWLHETLFTLGGYKVPGYGQYSLSTGKIDPSNKGFLPLLAKSMILVKNVKITADWTSTDTQMIASATSSSASVGWGPFAVSASYQSGTGEKHFTSTFDGRTLTIPHIQAIGFISTLVPACPPISGL